MYYVLLLAVIIAVGYLAKLEKKDRFCLAQAFLLVTISTAIIAAFLALIMGVIFIFLPNLQTKSLFVVILIVAILLGVGLFWLYYFLIGKLKIKKIVMALSEYIVQWGLIYATIYQIIFDNLFKEKVKPPSPNEIVAQPSEILVFILPSLISVWIAIILYRVRTKEIT